MADLTGKQRAFIEHYFACGMNATEAARRAGYKGDDNTLAVIGSQNLRNHKIKAVLEDRFAEMTMGRHEVLARLTEQGRASMAEFVSYTEDGKPYTDLAKAKHRLHLVKELKQDEEERRVGMMTFITRKITVKLYDAQAALEKVGKYHKLFTEKVEFDLPPELQAALERENLKLSDVLEAFYQELARANRE